MKTKLLSLTLIAAVVICCSPYKTQAQTLEAEGVVGDLDRQSRNPHLTAGVTIGENSVIILADAFHPSDEFKKYPIQFDFLVNRTLFTTQYRSVKLPGPIGVTVSSSVATVPFNYVVVAKVLHPNSVYTTVIEGAATEDASGTVPVAALDCTLTIEEDGKDVIYTSDDVAIKDSSTGTYSADFTAKHQSNTEQTASIAASVNGEEDAGTFTVTREGFDSLTVTGEATVETSEGSLTKISIHGEDGESLICQ